MGCFEHESGKYSVEEKELFIASAEYQCVVITL